MSELIDFCFGRLRHEPAQVRILRVRSYYLIVAVDTGTDVMTIVRVPHGAMHLDRHLP